jgi:hypothetical protein
MKYGIKVNRPEVGYSETVQNWRAEYLIIIEDDNSSHLYYKDDYITNKTQPLASMPNPAFYDSRSDVYLTVNYVEKTIDISRDFISWTKWRPVPSRLLSSQYLYSLSTRMQAFFNTQTNVLEIYEMPLWEIKHKLYLDGKNLLGIQLLDLDHAVLFRDQKEGQYAVRYSDLTPFADVPTGQFNYVSSVDQQSDLPKVNNKLYDVIQVNNSQQTFVWAEEKYGWHIKWYKRTSSTDTTIDETLPPTRETFDRVVDYADFQLTATDYTYFNAVGNALLTPVQQGDYTLHVSCDGGLKVALDGVIIFTDWTDIPKQITIPLGQIGPTSSKILQFAYYTNLGPQHLKFTWSKNPSEKPYLNGPFDVSYNDTPGWAPLDYHIFANISDRRQSLISPLRQLDIAGFYLDKTVLTKLTDPVRTDLLPRIKYFDYLYPEPFSAITPRRSQFHTDDLLLPDLSVKEKLLQIPPLTSGYGAEYIYSPQIQNLRKPWYLGIWSIGVKSLIPIDFNTGKAVLENYIMNSSRDYMNPYNYLVLKELNHVEVFNPDGIRLARHADNHTHTHYSIWHEAYNTKTITYTYTVTIIIEQVNPTNPPVTTTTKINVVPDVLGKVYLFTVDLSISLIETDISLDLNNPIYSDIVATDKRKALLERTTNEEPVLTIKQQDYVDEIFLRTLEFKKVEDQLP